MRIVKQLLLAFALLAGLATARAEAHQVRYEGMHPVPAEYGGGFCQIDFPHVHVFEPQRADVLYRNHEGGYAFVGDPVPYGYDGPKHAFYGPHPMQDENGDVEYCYLEGPHYHTLPPPVTVAAQFKMKGGVYFYGGHFPQAYYELRPRYARINTVYRPLEYARPVVVATGPDVIVEEPAPAVIVPSRPVVVAGGGVGVGMGVGVTAGIGVHAGAGVVVGAPAPAVVVGGPPVVVYDRQPRTVIVEDHRPVEVIRYKRHHDEDHEGDHDNGNHWGRRWR
jgi:hypothetical protein